MTVFPRGRWARPALLLASVVLCWLLVLAILHLLERVPPTDTIWFSVLPPENAIFSSDAASVPSTQLAISPDGRHLAFIASQHGGKPFLWVRDLRSLDAEPLAGTENASYPFWSPDSGWVGFFADGKLRKIEASGNGHEVLCDAPMGRGGAWNRDGIIVFASHAVSPLSLVPASGGAPRQLTTLNAMRQENSHRWPHFLPDHRRFLYFARSARKEFEGVYVTSLDAPHGRLLRPGYFAASYSSGYLLFVHEGALKAQRLDDEREQLAGETQTVARPVGGSTVNYASVSVSATGRLAYGSGALPDSELRWLNRAGAVVGRIGQPGDYVNVQLSSGGKRVAVGLVDPRFSTPDLWVIEAARDVATRFTHDPYSTDSSPVWSRDGNNLVFRSDRAGMNDLYRMSASGSGDSQLIFRSNTNKFPTQWSASRNVLVYHTQLARGDWDILALSMDTMQSGPLVSTPHNETYGEISPDGRLLAYSSDESGSPHVYVRTIDSAGERVQLASAAGIQPRWRSDGLELYFLDVERRMMMAVPIGRDHGLTIGTPVSLFEIRVSGLMNPYRNHYAVSADGQRFLVSTLRERPMSPPITVVMNWPGTLQASAVLGEGREPSDALTRRRSRSIDWLRDPIWQFVGVLIAILTLVASRLAHARSRRRRVR